MFRRLLTFSILSCLVSGVALAQTGTVSGTILDGSQEGNPPVPFANIVLVGTTFGATTDFDGKYSFLAEPGNYQIVIKYVGLLPDTSNITVVEDQTVTKSVTLKTSAELLKTVNIEGKANRETEEVLQMERQETTSIVQNIGAKKLQATGSSNVSEGLTKVAGLSVVGSKHVFVRGMGDRYNTAYLNGLPLPSADPDKKVMPLNIFPSSIISSLNVSKAFTGDLYGDFAGGAINIRTKDYPEDPTLNVKVGAGYNSTSSFQDFQTYEGGNTDYWGVDDGTRDIPSSVVPQEDSYNSRNESGSNPFANNFTPKTVTAAPNTNFSIVGGNFFETDKISEGSGIGFLVVRSHKNNTSYREGQTALVNASDKDQLRYDVFNYRRSTNSSTLANLNLKLHRNHAINFNYTAVNLSTDDSRETRGSHFDYDSDIFSRRYTYRENRLGAFQVFGSHAFLEEERISVNWGFMTSTANAKEPDRRQLVWLFNEDSAEDRYIINSIDVNDNHRFYSDLEENETSVRAEATGKIILDKEDTERVILGVKGGINQKTKERDFDFRQFNYRFPDALGFFPDGILINDPDADLSNDNLDAGGYTIEELSNGSSAYNVTLEILAPFGEVTWSPTKQLTLVGGLRMEDGNQTTRYNRQNQSSIRERVSIDNTDFLPSFTAKYEVIEGHFIRGAFSQTITRPGFREVAPFQYIEFFAGAQTVGNPDLINGSNSNIDLRYETYPNRGELIGVTAFYKDLQTPIERVNIAVASGQLQSFVNATKATVAGVEIEFIKKLSGWVGDSVLLSDFSIGANASLLFSEVEIDTNATVNGSSVINTNTKRPLQGASPYLVNFDVTWEKWLDPDHKATATLSYNVFGRRLWSAGAQGIGDIYEVPVNTVNLTANMEIKNKYVIGFSGKNLINPLIRQSQESSIGEEVLVNEYRTGVVVGLNFTYKFL